VRETKATKEEIERIMKSGHDYYLLPEQAIKMGIVDKIIGDDLK
jgi:ATP-dependent protease ClpP protease subunit